jgi:threonine synthase
MLLQGGAKDGGLFVPVDDLPHLSIGELSRLASLSYSDRALRIIEKLVHPRDIPPSLLSNIVKQAYSSGNAVRRSVSLLLESFYWSVLNKIKYAVTIIRV